MRRWTGFLLITLGFALRSAAVAQQPPQRLRVFLDCSGEGGACDRLEFRTEIQFVDWVLEATVADVHIIMTSQDAGAGDQHIIDLIGRNSLTNVTDRLTFNSRDTDTRDEVLRASTALLKAGLARYVAHIGRAQDIRISAAEEDEDEPRVVPGTRDPWNYWVFRVGVDGDAEGETRQRQSTISADLSANRTTLNWRYDFQVEGDFTRRRVELSDGVFTNDRDDWQASGLIVKSVAGQWSTGGFLSAGSFTRLNQRLASRAAAAVEYSFFPYEQANRRALILHYQVGVSNFEYQDTTIYGRLQETLSSHRVALSYEARQTWGEASTAVQYSAYLNDASKNRLEVSGGVSVRLFRGLELEMDGQYERIRDQIYLSGEELSDEEIIDERRELETAYQYEFSVGLSYRFGSVLNNFVNNRFPFRVLGLN